MKLTLIFCSLLFSQIQGNELQNRIFEGVEANPQNPLNNIAFFSRDNPNIAFCSGAAFLYKWIVTTASCVKNLSPNNVRFKVGGSLVAPAFDATHFDEGLLIDKIIPHYYYNSNNRAFDIALIQPIQPLTSESILYNIPKINQNWVGRSVIIRGYGAVSSNEIVTVTDKLNEARTVLEPLSSCKKYVFNIPPYKLCSRRGRICNGDQGGALILADTNELLGIISVPQFTENHCGTNIEPIETYMNLAFHRSWISKIVQTNF